MTTLRSKIAISFLIITAVLALILAGILTGLVYSWEDLRGGRLLFCSMASFPLLLLLGLWHGYYALRIEGNRVSLRGIFRREDFFVAQITGYALTYVRMKGGGRMESLHVGLPGGRYFSLSPQYYRNYAVLRDALILEKTPDPTLLVKVTKYQKWQEFLAYSCIFGYAIVMLNAYLDAPEFKANPEGGALTILGSIIFAFLFVLWKCWEYLRAPKQL
ncbi:hypothetical protein HUU42_04800 [bacterium]|nr:hypothetical protein [bacterium]